MTISTECYEVSVRSHPPTDCEIPCDEFEAGPCRRNTDISIRLAEGPVGTAACMIRDRAAGKDALDKSGS